MYVEPNFKTKAEFKRAVKAGAVIVVYSPGPFAAPRHGDVVIEGPHFPEPHKWYARVRLDNGLIVKIVS